MDGTKGHLKEICGDPERLQEITGCLSNNQISISEDHMEITKGSLDDISRPASSDRSHAGESFSDGRRSLEVLTPDLTDMKLQESTHEMSDGEKHNSDQDSDEEAKDSELEKAIRKMKKLDQILSVKVSVEREVKRKSRELHQRLWQELQAVSLRGTPESSDEMDNTRRFLLLTPESFQDCSEDVDYVPVFETEVLDDLNLKSQKEENTESDKSELGQQVMEDQTPDIRQHGAALSKRRQDFVKKNIELAGAAGSSSVLLTNQERERIEELLNDLEEDHNNTEPMNQREVSLCVPVYGEGFSPDPSELKHLLHIESRLQQLLPVNDFMSMRSSWSDAGSSQSLDEMKMGDRVLWCVRERREQEKRLREIQHQLQLLDETEKSNLIDFSDALDGHSISSNSILSNLLNETDDPSIR